MMRLGETYLLLAEAQLKQNKLAEAAASINVLRTRAQAAMWKPPISRWISSWMNGYAS
jgi:hypothetical protein